MAPWDLMLGSNGGGKSVLLHTIEKVTYFRANEVDNGRRAAAAAAAAVAEQSVPGARGASPPERR